MNVYEKQMAQRDFITVDDALRQIADKGLASVGSYWTLLEKPATGEIIPVDSTQVPRYLDLGFVRPTPPRIEEIVPIPEPEPVVAAVAPEPEPLSEPLPIEIEPAPKPKAARKKKAT